MMSLVFMFTFNGSGPLIDWVDGFVADYIGKYVEILVDGTPAWLHSLIMDGIIAGVGGVLVFVPLLLFLYFFLAILEESGYMSRVAFLMDRIMKNLGLNGKAFVPMVLGFGCTVPAIYATRTLEDEKSRKLTAVMTPFMSCGARLPVYALFTAAFFSQTAGLVVISLYMTGVGVAIVVALILKRFPSFAIDERALLIELPPYRVPTLKMIWSSMLERTSEYIKKAVTIIMGVMIILWGLMYFPNKGDTRNSYLGKTAKIIQPIMKPTGFADRWETVAAIPPSIIAKEVVVGFMGQVLVDKTREDMNVEREKTTFVEDTVDQVKGLGIAVKDSVYAMLSFNMAGLFTPPTEEELEEQTQGVVAATSKLWDGDPRAGLKAFSFMIFILLVVPCVVTLASIKHEFGTKFMFFVVGVLTVVPYIVSTLVYQIGSLLFY
jgi:ferrous iron transport protein B